MCDRLTNRTVEVRKDPTDKYVFGSEPNMQGALEPEESLLEVP